LQNLWYLAVLLLVVLSTSSRIPQESKRRSGPPIDIVVSYRLLVLGSQPYDADDKPKGRIRCAIQPISRNFRSRSRNRNLVRHVESSSQKRLRSEVTHTHLSFTIFELGYTSYEQELGQNIALVGSLWSEPYLAASFRFRHSHSPRRSSLRRRHGRCIHICPTHNRPAKLVAYSAAIAKSKALAAFS
jgi:hypothetical protein